MSTSTAYPQMSEILGQCSGARAGVIPTGAFVNATAGAQYVATNGQW
jgi:hypothetical protein